MIAASLAPVMVMSIICELEPSADVAIRASCATWAVFMALAPSLLVSRPRVYGTPLSLKVNEA